MQHAVLALHTCACPAPSATHRSSSRSLACVVYCTLRRRSRVRIAFSSCVDMRRLALCLATTTVHRPLPACSRGGKQTNMLLATLLQALPPPWLLLPGAKKMLCHPPHVPCLAHWQSGFINMLALSEANAAIGLNSGKSTAGAAGAGAMGHSSPAASVDLLATITHFFSRRGGWACVRHDSLNWPSLPLVCGA